MEKNVGTADRVIRFIIGACAGALAVYLDSLLSVIPGAIAVVALISGISGRCGLYKVLGLNTARARPPDGEFENERKVRER